MQDHFANLENLVKVSVNHALTKSDLICNKNSLLISTEKALNPREVKERVGIIVGEKNLLRVTDLKFKTGRNSTYKVDFAPKIANEQGNSENSYSKPTYTISKFYSDLKIPITKMLGTVSLGQILSLSRP